MSMAQNRKTTGPYSFLNSCVSLRNDFANDMRTKNPSTRNWNVFLDTRKFSNHSLSENVSYACSNQVLHASLPLPN